VQFGFASLETIRCARVRFGELFSAWRGAGARGRVDLCRTWKDAFTEAAFRLRSAVP